MTRFSTGTVSRDEKHAETGTGRAVTHYSDTTCPTCHAPPRHRCDALNGFGGAHATRIAKAHQETE